MNKFVTIGNLGMDPTLRETASGSPVCNFSLAVDRRTYSNNNGTHERHDLTDWMPVVTWNNLARTCALYLQKGSLVCVEGRIQPRDYVDAHGIKHHTFEVVATNVEFLGKTRKSPESTVNIRPQTAT